MSLTKVERVAAFSAALQEIYNNCKEGKKTNFSELGRKYGIKRHAGYIKKALREKHLINEDCTKWNPNYTEPNPRLAETIYSMTKEYIRITCAESLLRRKERNANNATQTEEISYEEVPEQKHLSLEETVEFVKHYGIFKVLWKCLFG